MKKLFGIIFLFVFSILPVNAETTTDWNTTTGLARVEKIGKNLLSKNGLPTQVKFTVMETDEINAFASGENEICVYTGLLKYVNDDAELAGVIAHEMGHILNNHVAKQSIISNITNNLINRSKASDKVKTGVYIANQLSLLKMSRTQEYEADITGVDLMTKAGYNPLAMISFLYKISGNYIDILQTHPSGDKRTMYSFDYITYNYPAKAVLGYSTDSYKQFLAYATPIVVARTTNSKKQAKYKQEQEDLKQERIEKMQKYQQEKVNGWSASYNFLRALSTSQ